MADKKDKSGKHVVIYDTVSYTTGSVKENDLEYHTLSRGDEIPEGVSDEQVKAWLDRDKHGPYGAIAPQGSRLATMMAGGMSIAEDPLLANRRLAEAAGDEFRHVDPAHEYADVEKTTISADVARSRAGMDATLGGRTGGSTGEGSGANVADMEDDDLRAFAEREGVKVPKDAKPDEVRRLVREHVERTGGGTTAEGETPKS